MMWKRRKYSLRNCNPGERRNRKKINELDFKTKFPFFSFDNDRVDLHLLRRFLCQNKIPARFLYNKYELKEVLEDIKKNPDPKFKKINRFEIMDLEI